MKSEYPCEWKSLKKASECPKHLLFSTFNAVLHHSEKHLSGTQLCVNTELHPSCQTLCLWRAANQKKGSDPKSIRAEMARFIKQDKLRFSTQTQIG